MMHLSVPSRCVAGPLLLAACAAPAPVQVAENQPLSERVLAARKLQQPLSIHLCQAAVYPVAGQDWSADRLAVLSGRGASFREALEALCREADGLKAHAVVDLHYWRTPDGWSQSHELRGTALRFTNGFLPPPAPQFAEVRPPPRPERTASEPPPSSGQR